MAATDAAGQSLRRDLGGVTESCLRGHFSPLVIFVGALLILTLGSCGTLKPTIQATNTGTSLVISGSGFSPASPTCVQLSLLGLDPPNAVLEIGRYACSAKGSFSTTWPYSYAYCTPVSTRSVVVEAVDNQLDSASQKITFSWSAGCNLTGFCGTAGLRACNGHCENGNLGDDGLCHACGGEGQPECTVAPACQSGLHPNAGTSGVVCTATCGNAIGSPCTPNSGNAFCGGHPPVIDTYESPCVTQQPAQGSGGYNYATYSCYGGATIPSNGTCVCQPGQATLMCQVNSSPTWPNVGAGVCTPGPVQSKPPC